MGYRITGVTKLFRVSQRVTGDYKGLKGITKDYRGLQRFIGDRKGLQEIDVWTW